MPRTVINETFDATGALVSSEQVTVPSIIAGQYAETHQVAVGGTTLRLGPAVTAPAITRLSAATPLFDTGQRMGSAALVVSDLGTGWVPFSALIAIGDL